MEDIKVSSSVTNDLGEEVALRYEPVSNPYAEHIERLVRSNLPQFNSTREDVLEAVFEAIVGTKWIRQGPRPSPEGSVAIRDVLRAKIAQNAPIPVLVGAGSVKSGSTLSDQVDLAELMGLRTLKCLRCRVAQVYAPGIEARVRLGDLTRLTLSPEIANVSEIVDSYAEKFRTLVEVLGYDSFLRVVRESEFTSSAEWSKLSTTIAAQFVQYFDEIDTYALADGEHEDRSVAFEGLTELGWRGEVTRAAREYFADRYRRLYGEISEVEIRVRTAQYLSSNLTRKLLDASGARDWNGHVEVSITSPLPNAPKNAPRVYYRTIPDHTHLPWWKAIGVVQIGEHASHVRLLNHWNRERLVPGFIVLGRGARSIKLPTPYLIDPIDHHFNFDEMLKAGRDL